MTSAVSFVNLMFFVVTSYFKFFWRGSNLPSVAREAVEDSGFGPQGWKFLQNLKDGDSVYLALDGQHPDFF